MAFTKIAAAGIDTTGSVVIQNLNTTGVVTAGSIVATTGTFSGNVSIAGTLTYEDVTNIDSIGIVTARSSVIVGGGLSVAGVSTFRTLTVQDNNSPEKLATIGVSSVGVGTGLLVEVSTNSSGQIISFNSSGIAGGNAYGYGNGDVVTLDGPGSPTSKVRIGIAQVTPPNGLAAVLISQSSLPAGSGYTPNQTNVLVSTTNITPRAYSLPAAKLPTTAFTPIPTTVLVGANSDQTLTNKIIIAGAGTSTGTASQTLQVTGGAYVSGNLGIGTTNPLVKLDSRGTVLIASNSTGNNLLAFGDSISYGPLTGAPDGSHGSSFIVGSSSTVSGAPSHLSFWTCASGSVSERARIISGGFVGIGTTNPTSHLSVRGTIESLADTNDLTSSSEGGQLILRAPTNQAGTKYRYNIDNYYGTSGGQPSATSNFRIFREDDSTTANGVVLLNIDSSGRVVAPSQPSGAWALTVNASGVRSISIKKNTGNHVSSVPGGNGSTHGSVGRFTAPVNGAYLISLFSTAVGPSSQCLMSVYGSWTTATNTVYATQEVFDCRSTRPPEDGGGWSQVFYFNANDYWEIDWYRPSPTTYIDSVMTMNVTVHLLG